MAIKVQGTTVVYDDRTFRVNADASVNRPSTPEQGMILFNTTDNRLETYTGSNWESLSFAAANGVITLNKTLINSNYTISSGENGHSVGPINIASGVGVTVSDNQKWVII